MRKGIRLEENYLEISLNLSNNQIENNPFKKLFTQLMNLDHRTRDALIGELDTTKQKMDYTVEKPTMVMHFSNTEQWKSPFISVIITEPRYEIVDNRLFISY